MRKEFQPSCTIMSAVAMNTASSSVSARLCFPKATLYSLALLEVHTQIYYILAMWEYEALPNLLMCGWVLNDCLWDLSLWMVACKPLLSSLHISNESIRVGAGATWETKLIWFLHDLSFLLLILLSYCKVPCDVKGKIEFKQTFVQQMSANAL